MPAADSGDRRRKDSKYAPNPEAALKERGLPQNLDAERFVLGAIIGDDGKNWPIVNNTLTRDDFFLDKHRKIFGAMADLAAAGETIDRVTVANELNKKGQLQAVDGLSYLVELDNGLPQIFSLDKYVKIVEEMAVYRQSIFLGQKYQGHAAITDRPVSVLLSENIEALQRLLDRVERYESIKTTMQVLEEFPGGPSAFLDPSKREKGIQTGFRKLDELTGGFHKGKLYIVAGLTGSGKSVFAKDITYYAAINGYGVGYSSQEMDAYENIERMLAGVAKFDLGEFRRGELNGPDIMARMYDTVYGANGFRDPDEPKPLVELPIYWDDTAGLTYRELSSRISNLVNSGKIQMAVIDYLQIMNLEIDKYANNEAQAISYVTRGLKRLAKRLRIPIILLSQFSRSASRRDKTDPRPQLSDLKGSSSIEQDADAVIFTYRPEQDRKKRAEYRGRAELILAKQRGGPTGICDVRFEGYYTRFRNLSVEEQEALEAERATQQE